MDTDTGSSPAQAFRRYDELIRGFLCDKRKGHRASLLPPGEGQDEGEINNQSVSFSNTLTPILSRKERGLSGTAVIRF